MLDDILKVTSVSKIFPGEVIALDAISFSVKKGAICGIIGKSGAGKSTLFRVILGLDKPTKGTLSYDARKMGVIFQHFNLFSSKTALENVAFPLEIAGNSRKEALKKARELLSLVHLEEKGNHYSATLSGGEKQRVAIARALALNPTLLLSDEATSALDPETKKSILTTLAELNKNQGLTILMITHEMEVIKEICSDVIVLSGGKIVEEGSVVDVFTAPKHPVTQAFLEVGDLPEFFPITGELLKLHFKGESATGPIISRIVKRFDVEISILMGGLDALRSTIVGHLVVSMTGKAEEREKVHRFLADQGITYEVMR